MLGGLGGGLTATNLMAVIVGAEIDDDSNDDVLGPPVLYNSVERTRKMRRSFWAARGGEGEAMAAVVLVGGGGRIR